MLSIERLTFRIGGHVLIDEATAQIPAGHRVGVVGRNGAGKSTLLDLIRGELHADSGSITIEGRSRIGFLAQEAPGGDTTPLAAVLAADGERAALVAEAETSEDAHRIAEIHARLTDLDAHSAPARAASILAGLGFDAAMQDRPLSSFSGGWRMRVALAAVLFAEPDLLLLDEPTNHLDFEATLWLEAYLRGYPHTLLLVSHDRQILNTAVTHILHLHDRKLTLYAGGYDRFEETRQAKLALAQALAAKQEAQRKHMQAFVDRFRYKATKARQAQSRLKALARLTPIVTVSEDPSITLNFPAPEELRPPLISVIGGAVGYAPGSPVLRQLGLRLDPDDRVALLGANGNGKSTLAKLLAGRLELMEGSITRAPKLRCGFFAQHQIEDMEPEETPFQAMGRLMPEARPEQVRARLGRFGFSQDKAEVRIRDLSGGEKARLNFALITHSVPSLLILDEPTNHLDLQSREALIEAINEFTGAVIIISHDWHLLEMTADRLWLVAGGRVQPFEGDLEDYRRAMLAERLGKDTAKTPRNGSASRKDERRANAERRKELEPLRRQARDAEALVARLTKEKATLDAELAKPETYSDRARAAEITRRQGQLAAQIARAEEQWLEAAQALEDASTAA